MNAGMRLVVVPALVMLMLVPVALAGRQAPASGAPLPVAETFLAAARENLSRSQRQQDRYAYKERRTDVHMNPFGRVGTGATRVYDVVPTADGMAVMRRLIERDGQPVNEPAERRKLGERRNRTQTPRGFDDVVDTLQFTLDRREVIEGRPTIVVTFAARPNAKPRTREGKMARVFTGSIWVDEAAQEVSRVEATAVDDLTVGFGVVARLHKGTKVMLERRQAIDGLWLPTSIRFAGEGRAMVFRKLQVNYIIEWFDYRDVGSSVAK
jgi:hypothetical protein